ncbi:MAG: hypothetical protein LPK09_13645, partial [Hymenobacteraceae bacterium]|nr:hypothetical protein [Hymenobacteraceae bacterium]
QFVQYIFFDNRLYLISMDIETLPATDTVYTWLHNTYGAPAEGSNALSTHQIQVWEQDHYELRVLQERLDEGNVLRYSIEYRDKDLEKEVHAYEKKRREE